MAAGTANKANFTTSLAIGAVAAGMLAGVGIGTAPTAHATCASFFGLGNSANCTSNLTSIAIAIGTDSVAHADGLFGSAIAIGTEAKAYTNGPFGSAISVGFITTAVTNDAFNIAVSSGTESVANAGGVFALAVQLGKDGIAETGGSGQFGNIGANIAINIAPTQPATGVPRTLAVGIGNIAVNLFGNASGNLTHDISAIGTANIATNFGGNDNIVDAGSGGAGNVAFNVFGSGNGVQAAPGPLAVAGSIFQNGAVVIKNGPGFNINGIKVGGAAATPSNRVTKPAAAASRSGNPAATASSPRTGKPAAASRGTRN